MHLCVRRHRYRIAAPDIDYSAPRSRGRLALCDDLEMSVVPDKANTVVVGYDIGFFLRKMTGGTKMRAGDTGGGVTIERLGRNRNDGVDSWGKRWR